VWSHPGDVLGQCEDLEQGDLVRFIDREPEYFPVIVAYMDSVKTWRSKPIEVITTTHKFAVQSCTCNLDFHPKALNAPPITLPKSRKSLKLLKKEAEFYGLIGLAKQADAAMIVLLDIQ
jgi:hypothetical protein